ncbi:MAG: FeoA family protein [Varibaculum sp.]|nr:FeoA family protein [Varibaculum sp.]
MELKRLPRKNRARITAMNISPCHLLRLSELGLRPGAELSVVNRGAFGGLVINIAGTRLAIDARSAREIEVQVTA